MSAGEVVATISAPGIGQVVIRQATEDGALPTDLAGMAPGWHGAGTPCQTTDPDAWFDDAGQVRAVVVEGCRSCPFRRRCLADALSFGPDFGRWGGYSARQVARMRQMLGVRRGRELWLVSKRDHSVAARRAARLRRERVSA